MVEVCGGYGPDIDRAEKERRAFFGSKGNFDVIKGPLVTQKDLTPHPTTKPVWLYRKLIEDTSHRGDLILDPVAGSGTCGEACIKTGRDFILIEKDPRYFKIMDERIQALTWTPKVDIVQDDKTGQLSMFA